MTFIEMRWGGNDGDYGIEQIRKMIVEMSVKDAEHPDAWMGHDSGWTLTLHEQGLVIWGNPDEGTDDRHISTTDTKFMERLLVLLGEGRIPEIEAHPWEPGRGIRQPSREEIQEMEAAMLAHQLVQDKEWYESLEAGNSSERCATPGCERDSLKRSIMCRRHHFEMIRGRLCPFHH